MSATNGVHKLAQLEDCTPTPTFQSRPTNLPRPFYKNQALVQADTLACRIELLNKDIELTAVSLLDQRDAALAKREWLLNELNNLPATD